MAGATTTISLKGPLFSGRAPSVIHRFLDEAMEDVADEGLRLMHQSAGVFRNPSGYWESRLVTNRAGDSRVVDDPVVYNAWLEGVSSRNAASRFKGYRIWRRSTGYLQAQVGEIAARTLVRYIGDLG